MLMLPEPIMTLLIPFQPLFRQPTWVKAQILFMGAILATGKRTVTAALRVMGLSDERHFSNYHQVLNRAVWSPRRMSEMLLALLMKVLDAALYEPAPPHSVAVGRPRKKGKRLPTLQAVLDGRHTEWQSVQVNWYDGQTRLMAKRA